MLHVLKVILILLVGVHSDTIDDYCKLSKSNTICSRKSCKPDKSLCNEVLFSGPLTSGERQAVLNRHNELRNEHASGKSADNPLTASNMNILGYSLEIENLLICWINRCQFEHDKSSGRSSPNYKQQGQNLATMWGSQAYKSYTTENLKGHVTQWFNEIKDFQTKNMFDSATYTKTGHYTQLIWAKSKYIGCGKIAFVKNKEQHILFGCNYWPAGNFKGAAIFEQGEPCSACENKLKCNKNYTSLCGETPVFPIDPGYTFSTAMLHQNPFILYTLLAIIILNVV